MQRWSAVSWPLPPFFSRKTVLLVPLCPGLCVPVTSSTSLFSVWLSQRVWGPAEWIIHGHKLQKPYLWQGPKPLHSSSSCWVLSGQRGAEVLAALWGSTYNCSDLVLRGSLNRWSYNFNCCPHCYGCLSIPWHCVTQGYMVRHSSSAHIMQLTTTEYTVLKMKEV